MESRKTQSCNVIYKLEGGDESNDLHGWRTTDTEGNPVACGIFIPNDLERKQLAEGAKIVVAVWGNTVPPMAVALVNEEEVKEKPIPTLASACMHKKGCVQPSECATLGRCTLKI